MALNLPWAHNENINIRKTDNTFSLLQNEINKLFNNFFEERPSFWTNNEIAPAVDIIENDKSFIIEVELPGLDQKDISVDINDAYLTIKGEKKISKENESENYIRQERYYGNYQRVIALPETADANKANATFKKGVLLIDILKKAEAIAKSKKLEIKEAA